MYGVFWSSRKGFVRVFEVALLLSFEVLFVFLLQKSLLTSVSTLCGARDSGLPIRIGLGFRELPRSNL